MTKLERPWLARAGILFGQLIADQRGATAIEYSMLGALLGVVISAGIWQAGEAFNEFIYDRIIATLSK